MKRYWLFAGLQYHPTGGMADFRVDGDSVEELRWHIKWYRIPNESYVLEPSYRSTFVKRGADGFIEDAIESAYIRFSCSNDSQYCSWYQILDTEKVEIVEAYSSYVKYDATNFSLPLIKSFDPETLFEYANKPT